MGTLSRQVEYDVDRRKVTRLGLLGMGIALLGMIAAPIVGKGAVVGVVASLSLVFLIASAWALGRIGRFVKGALTIDDASVRLGAVVLPRKDIKSAYFAPAAGRLRSCVRLLDEGDRFLAQIAVDGPLEAEEILDALALGASKRTARFPAYASRWSASWVAGMTTFLVGFLPMALSIPFKAPWLFVLTLLLFIGGSVTFIPADVLIGADGILHKTRLAPRFFSWAEVVAVHPHRRGIVIETKKEKVVIPLTGKVWLHNEHEQVTQKALLARAHEALTAYRRGDEPDVSARIARGGRAVDVWLRDLFDREGHFRQAPLLDDQLWTVLESATAETSARAGAAAVLARSAAEPDRARFRVAAEACTAPKLRVVLDRAASGAPETEIEQALHELEDERGAAS